MGKRRNARLSNRNARITGEARDIGLTRDLEADVRYTFRGIRRHPAFAAVAILAVAASLVGVVLLASHIPAQRAARVGPMDALRWE